jgi:tetratricopeptide (TPR) repeat protein
LGITTYIYIGESPELERDRYFKKGEEYIAQGKFSEALIMFKNSLKLWEEFGRAIYRKPEMTKARYQIGTLYALSQNIPLAKAQLAEIGEQEPNSLQVRYLAATIALAEKDPGKALK